MVRNRTYLSALMAVYTLASLVAAGVTTFVPLAYRSFTISVVLGAHTVILIVLTVIVARRAPGAPAWFVVKLQRTLVFASTFIIAGLVTLIGAQWWGPFPVETLFSLSVVVEIAMGLIDGAAGLANCWLM